MTQMVLGHFSGAKLQANQHTGVYIAYVTDNWENNPALPAGTIRFKVPKMGEEGGWVESPYIGRGIPPIGSECVVAFEGVLGDMPRVIAFNDWQSSPLIFVEATAPYESYLAVGYLWIQP